MGLRKEKSAGKDIERVGVRREGKGNHPSLLVPLTSYSFPPPLRQTEV